MITAQKVMIYSSYDGNLDAWNKGSRKREREVFNDDDWYSIQDLVQDIKLMIGNHVSDSYKQDILRRLEMECEDEETIALLTEESKRLTA